MATTTEELEKIRSRRGYVELAEEQERQGKATVTHRGKEAKIVSKVNGNAMLIYDDPRDLPKADRSFFVRGLRTLFPYLVLLLIVGLGAFAVTHPLIIAEAIRRVGG
jgi:hypothetical protein